MIWRIAILLVALTSVAYAERIWVNRGSGGSGPPPGSSSALVLFIP